MSKGEHTVGPELKDAMEIQSSMTETSGKLRGAKVWSRGSSQLELNKEEPATGLLLGLQAVSN